MILTREQPGAGRVAAPVKSKIETHSSEEFFDLIQKIRDAGCVVYGIKTLAPGPHYEFDTNYNPDRLL